MPKMDKLLSMGVFLTSLFLTVLFATLKADGSFRGSWPSVMAPAFLFDGLGVLATVTALTGRARFIQFVKFALKMAFEVLLALRLEGMIDISFLAVVIPLVLLLGALFINTAGRMYYAVFE